MSTEKTVVVKSQFAIVNAIAALLKLGDFGKLESFFTKVIKKLESEIDVYKRNISNYRHNSKHVVAELEDNLADAEEEQKEAFKNVSPDQVSNNASQKAFIEEYLSNLASGDIKVKSINDKIKAEKEALTEAIKAANAEIAVREERIDTIRNAE